MKNYAIVILMSWIHIKNARLSFRNRMKEWKSLTNRFLFDCHCPRCQCFQQKDKDGGSKDPSMIHDELLEELVCNHLRILSSFAVHCCRLYRAPYSWWSYDMLHLAPFLECFCHHPLSKQSEYHAFSAL